MLTTLYRVIREIGRAGSGLSISRNRTAVHSRAGNSFAGNFSLLQRCEAGGDTLSNTRLTVESETAKRASFDGHLASTNSMKRIALLGLLVPAFLVACGGGSGESSDDLALPPQAPAPAPAAEPSESMSSGEPESMSEAPPAADEGEEIGEQRGLAVDDESAEMSMPEPEDSMRGEDTSRPLAPVIAGTTLDGEPISIEDFKGRPVMVKVFAEH